MCEDFTTAASGDPYMNTLRQAHINPIIMIFMSSPPMANVVVAKTNPKNPMSKVATNFAVLTCKGIKITLIINFYQFCQKLNCPCMLGSLLWHDRLHRRGRARHRWSPWRPRTRWPWRRGGRPAWWRRSRAIAASWAAWARTAPARTPPSTGSSRSSRTAGCPIQAYVSM